jgi:hypothetical protein
VVDFAVPPVDSSEAQAVMSFAESLGTFGRKQTIHPPDDPTGDP